MKGRKENHWTYEKFCNHMFSHVEGGYSFYDRLPDSIGLGMIAEQGKDLRERTLRGKREGREHACLIVPDSSVVGGLRLTSICVGTDCKVGFRDALPCELDIYRAIASIHTHPNCVPPSPDDLLSLRDGRYIADFVYTPKTTYMLMRSAQSCSDPQIDDARKLGMIGKTHEAQIMIEGIAERWSRYWYGKISIFDRLALLRYDYGRASLEELADVYDRFLRNEAIRSAYVVYVGSTEDDTLRMHPLDTPLPR